MFNTYLLQNTNSIKILNLLILLYYLQCIQFVQKVYGLCPVKPRQTEYRDIYSVTHISFKML